MTALSFTGALIRTVRSGYLPSRIAETIVHADPDFDPAWLEALARHVRHCQLAEFARAAVDHPAGRKADEGSR